MKKNFTASPGEFTMGGRPEEIAAAELDTRYAEHWQPNILSEGPAHRVRLTRPYYLGVHEVTQAQYTAVMKENPAHFSAAGDGQEKVPGLDTSGFPVEKVDWSSAVACCEMLQAKDGIVYRLPTEAEWEFACRAGTETYYWSGNQPLPNRGSPRFVPEFHFGPAEEFPLNPFGLRGMHGCVREWVSDLWTPDYYARFEKSTAINPAGPFVASHLRVTKSSSFYNRPSESRSATRYGTASDHVSESLGFRMTASVMGVKVKTRTSLAIGGSRPAAKNPLSRAVAIDRLLKNKPAAANADKQVAPCLARSKAHDEPQAGEPRHEHQYASRCGEKFCDSECAAHEFPHR